VCGCLFDFVLDGIYNRVQFFERVHSVFELAIALVSGFGDSSGGFRGLSVEFGYHEFGVKSASFKSDIHFCARVREYGETLIEKLLMRIAGGHSSALS
jgi:hypothetical protein